jgi:hypothetical protein
MIYALKKLSLDLFTVFFDRSLIFDWLNIAKKNHSKAYIKPFFSDLIKPFFQFMELNVLHLHSYSKNTRIMSH